MRDLGQFMRVRFAHYVAALRNYSEEFGISGIPYLVNIHGTEAGGGATFPIGISQLFPSYTQSGGYLAGSDHYLGDLDGGNAADLYLMNAFMDAVNLPDQPLASFEFEAGSGDYSQGLGSRNDPAAADFKLRMSVAQGNRLINYYLFTGGINYRMDITTGDGNDRISFTGERHGTGAPIDPEGRESYTLPRLARTNRMLAAFEAKLAVAEEEHDNLVMGFVPDAFMTESTYPGNPVMGEIATALRRSRFGGPATVLARALLHLGVRYTAVDLQANPVPPDNVLTLGSTLHMDRALQHSLADWIRAGGMALFHGEIPRFDMTGNPCTILMDSLGLQHREMHWGTHRHFPSIEAQGWAAPRSELRVGWAQTFRPVPEHTLFHLYGTDGACGFDLEVGSGRAIVLTAEVPADIDLFAHTLAELGVEPGLRHDHPLHGVFTTSTRTPDGERFIHAINLDGVDKVLHLEERGTPHFGGRPVTLRRRDAVMLPVGVDLDGVHVAWSTAEITGFDTNELRLRLTGDADAILLRSDRRIAPSDSYRIERGEDGILIKATVRGTGEELISVKWD